jgi:ectoine hydroxylase-related dioxygenase (phytanoyl-CoA dioxygenase family)
MLADSRVYSCDVAAELTHFDATADPDLVAAAIEHDGGVIIDGLLEHDVVQHVNDDVDAAVAAADPNETFFNPVMSAFHGPATKQVTGMPGLSRAFATDVMCHPMLLALCDRILLPSCARYQLNLGHLLQRGPGAEEQWLHRDELVWSDVPQPHPELQLASVIAFVDFTRENGATRVVPGSHRWPDRTLPAIEQMQTPVAPEQIACAEMAAGSAVVYIGGTIHAGGANVTDIPRRGAHLSYCLGWLRTEENNYLSMPPAYAATLPRLAQELIGYAVHDSIDRGGGYLGMVRMQDPVELMARGELS